MPNLYAREKEIRISKVRVRCGGVRIRISALSSVVRLLHLIESLYIVYMFDAAKDAIRMRTKRR